MPPAKAALPPARWLLAGGALVALASLAWLLSALFPRGKSALVQVPTAAPSAAPAPRPRPLDPAARPRAGVSGRVLDPGGKPVAGASVCAFARAELGLTSAQVRAPRCSASDASGAYALTDLFSQAPLTLAASAEGFAPSGSSLRLVDGEQRAGVDLVLRSGGVKIQGRVNDATGGVVPGALVVTGDSGEAAPRAFATSDGKGEFSLWVEPGQVRLHATASGYAQASASGPAPGHFFGLYLVPGSTLVGRAVIAGTETPVAGAKIESIQMEGGGVRASARSDDDGRFKVEGLLPGRYRIEATSEGREGYSRSSITLGMGETSPEQIVELDPAYVVAGRVVDQATGAPCPEGHVTITDPRQDEFSEAAIDQDGWARMASVIPGTYRVEVRCKGFVTRRDFPTITVVDRDAPPQAWAVERGGSLRVSVVDGQGKPVTSASVVAFPAKGGGSGTAYASHPEADGAFLLSGMVPGGYNLSVRADNGAQGSKEATVDGKGEGRVRVELPLSGAIEGVVEDDAHRPVRDVQVTASGPGHAMARSLDDGSFLLTGLPSGEYTLVAGDRRLRRRAADQEGQQPRVQVTLEAPGRAKAKIVIGRRDGRIEGRVVDRHGQPVSDAFLDVVRAADGLTGFPRYGGSGGPPVVTDTEGRFVIESLEPGEYNLRAQRKGGGEATVEHVTTGRRDVTLTIAEGASISGLLTSPKGPVERFDLEVREQKTSFHRSELFFHAGGAFTLGDLPAGTYELLAETPEGSASQQITLAEGEQKKDIKLTLTMRGVVTGRLVELEGGAPIAGLRVGVSGASQASVMRGEPGADNVTGRDGSFKLDGVLGGKWSLTIDTTDSAMMLEFDPVSIPVEIGSGGPTDVGSLKIPRRRLPRGERRGRLGIDVKPSDDPSDSAPLEILSVSSAAEGAGLKEGDVIVSIDGFDVRGPNRYLFSPLTTVPAGRSLSIGLARGTVTLVPR